MTRNGNVALASHRHSHESLLFTTQPHKAEQLGSEVAPGSLGGGGSALEVSIAMAKTVAAPCITVTISFKAQVTWKKS